jgi:hypothetical protein
MNPLTSLICRLRSSEGSTRESGRAIIEDAGGRLVSLRRGLHGGEIETYEVRSERRVLLLTWGLGGMIDRSHVQFPDEWRYVWA